MLETRCVIAVFFLGFWHWRAFWSHLNQRAQRCEVQKKNNRLAVSINLYVYYFFNTKVYSRIG